MSIEIDVVAALERLQLNTIEMAALLGVYHSAISRLRKSPVHQGSTSALYLLLTKAPQANVRILLRYWLTHEPKEWQVSRLIAVAKRWHPQYTRWLEAFRTAHPCHRDLIDTIAPCRRRRFG